MSNRDIFVLTASGCHRVSPTGQHRFVSIDPSVQKAQLVAAGFNRAWYLLQSGSLLVVDLETGRISGRTSIPNAKLNQAACSAGGSNLVAGSLEGTCIKVKAGNFQKIRLPSKSPITALAASPDGTTCLIAMLNRSVFVVNLQDAKVVTQFHSEFPIHSATFDPSRRIYWGATQIGLLPIPIAGGDGGRKFVNLGMSVSELRTADDGTLLFIDLPKLKGTARNLPRSAPDPSGVWLWRKGGKKMIGQTRTASVAISKDGRTACFVGTDGVLHVTDVNKELGYAASQN